MNPKVLLLLFFLISLSQKNTKEDRGTIRRSNISAGIDADARSLFFDNSFMTEILIDKLHSVVHMLEKVNDFNQFKLSAKEGSLIENLQGSLDLVRNLLIDTKLAPSLEPLDTISTISNTMSGIKNMGGLENIMSSIGPIMSLLGNQDTPRGE